ncbi:MAG: type II secretion system F family protein [Desulfobacteraceae bacterium]|nr:type II secretion system F family protein [Desulfobacteraceae bacterium]
MQYAYKAITEFGTKTSGVIQADSPEEAKNQLAGQGLIPVSLANGTAGSRSNITEQINLRLARIKLPDLIIFSKQFKTLFEAGIPMTRVMEVLEQQTENPKLKKTTAAISRDIQSGMSLTEAFREHPRIFSTMYCSMIEAGESSGRLGDVLERLIYLLQHEHKVKSDIKSAMQYPLLVVVTLFVAFLFLLTFVVPRFVDIFRQAGIDLPLPTRICLGLYKGLVVYWPVSLGILAAVIAGIYLYLKTEHGQYYKDYFLLKMPILGPVFEKGAMSRFAAIFAVLQTSGVSILSAFDVLSGTIGNKAVSKEFEQIQEQLKEGRGISGPLSRAKFFTPMVVHMVAIGEESGNLDDMLREVSAHYDDEVEYAVGRMAEAIGPVLIIALAAVVGFFALAIFLPMWDLTKMV